MRLRPSLFPKKTIGISLQAGLVEDAFHGFAVTIRYSVQLELLAIAWSGLRVNKTENC